MLSAARHSRLKEGDVISLETLLAFDHIDPDPLARIEGVDAAAAQRGDVNKHVFAAAVGRNETVTLVGLEPFDRALDGLGRSGSAAIQTAATVWRRRRAAVDVQNAGHQRTFRPGADLAGERGAFAHLLIAGPAQNRHRQKGVWRSVVRGDEAKALAGVEPLYFGLDATAGRGVFTEETGAAFEHESSHRRIECAERVAHRIIELNRRASPVFEGPSAGSCSRRCDRWRDEALPRVDRAHRHPYVALEP